jgi:hypothetical protein
MKNEVVFRVTVFLISKWWRRADNVAVGAIAKIGEVEVQIERHGEAGTLESTGDDDDEGVGRDGALATTKAKR